MRLNILQNMIWFAHILIIFSLTLISQIGGIIWLLVFAVFTLRKKKVSVFLKLALFLFIYLIISLLIAPPLATLSGKVQLPLSKKGNLIPHHFLYALLNRNYVTPSMHGVLIQTANQAQQRNKDLKLVYLDASFPFGSRFRMFPHLRHNDGKKVDLCFAYKKNGKLTTSGSSVSGYGNFELPKGQEINQPKKCREEGFEFYDFSKYLRFGKKRDFVFDDVHTRAMIMALLAHPSTELIFLEPHLIQRLEIRDLKMKYAGCHSVRHDDHLHYQIR